MTIPNLLKLGLAVCTLIFVSAAATKADTVNIVGNTTGSLATATVNCSFNAGTNTFTFTITNTSLFDARITGIGFDLPPGGNASANGLTGFTGNNPGAFVFSDGDLGNLPQFSNAVLDFGWIAGSNFAGGDPNDGIAPGNSLLFTVSGAAFTGFNEAQICNAILVRFQQVGATGQDSDVGGPTPVPEPATLLLLGTGLFGAMSVVRKKLKR